MIFRQMFDPQSSTYSYLLADESSREAVLIDTVFEHAGRDAALIAELGLHLRCVLDTHVHADHVTAAWLHKQRSGCTIAVSAASAAEGADRLLEDGDRISFGPRWLEARATPGHTDGCMTFVLDDRSMAFTGDALLIRGCGRTDFQQGDPRRLFHSVRGRILELPEACLLYPAHDYRGLTATSVGEERRFNPRLGDGVGVEDFAGYMNNLGLPHPKQIDVAVPANMSSGRVGHPAPAAVEGSWAPLNYTFAGIWEIQPAALHELDGRVAIIDVREHQEYEGPLVPVPGSLLVPLGELQARLGEWPRDRPLIAVCRSGARSAQACVLLQRAGFSRVANLAGGLLRWHAEGYGATGSSAASA